MFKFLVRAAGPAPTAQQHRDGDPARGEAAGNQPGAAARRELLERIGSFLIGHGLAVSADNLALAHAAFSGADLGLASRISAREIAGETIDQAWLDRQRPARRPSVLDDPREEPAERAELDALMSRLDSSIATFSAATSRAEGATAAYGESLAGHVGAMADQTPGGDILGNLVDIARAMLDRTREAEQEMKRSTQEASRLRESLERARREAEIDHLTGLPNRRAFEGVLEREYREAQRAIDLLSVAFCDIDHFKQVNDTHGHETGDRVIQAIGQVLARISNDRCHVARHGGEEFVVLLRGLGVNQARELLDGAREQLAARRFINRATDEAIGQITFSGGIADVFACADPRDALKAADEALYRAKAEGRNRICIAAK